MAVTSGLLVHGDTEPDVCSECADEFSTTNWNNDGVTDGLQ